MMTTVLHITAHMGGGVGKVLSGIAAYSARNSSDYRHSFLLLEQPEKMNFVDICRASHADLHVAKGKQDFLDAVLAADIVQVEWWHHPVMCHWLAEIESLPMRLVVWSHVSGCFYPWLPPGFIKVPQQFVFTSPYSLENPYWDEGTKEWAGKSCTVIYSSGGFDSILPTIRQKHPDKFCIGYAGTQAYSKLHPDFMEFCHAIKDVPQLEFRMVGDRTNETDLLKRAMAYGMEEKFHFSGYVNDMSREFSRMDVFGYLLNPTHFGTTENVLLEAMASELPVVCLNQCTEKYLVQHGKTGFLVNSIEEYGKVIRYLSVHPEERRRMGQAGRKHVIENFSVKQTAEKLHEVYGRLMGKEKVLTSFQQVFGTQPHEFFLSCLPPFLQKDFSVDDSMPFILREKSKSSLPHFCRTYPENEILRVWQEKLQKK